MLTLQRQELLLRRLEAEGQLLAGPLSRELEVSEDTIRRDLRELARKGLLQRVHGGALPASPAVADLAVRATLALHEKRALGRAAAELIEPGQVAFIDGGTTTLQLVRALSPALQATIITHSPVIAAELITHPRVEVVLIGGRLFKHSGVAVGAAALDAIRAIRADCYFMGATGIHIEHGVSTGDLEEAQIKRALIASAAETVLLATSDKLGRASPFVIAPAAAITTLLVTNEAPKAAVTPLRKLGLRVVSAKLDAALRRD